MTPAALPSSADAGRVDGVARGRADLLLQGLERVPVLLDHVVEALDRGPRLRIVLDLGELAVEGFFDVGLQRHHVADVVGNRLLVLLLHVLVVLIRHD